MYKTVALAFGLIVSLAACSQKPAKIVMHEPGTGIVRPKVAADAPFKPVFGDIKQSSSAPVKELTARELPPLEPVAKPVELKPQSAISVPQKEAEVQIAETAGDMQQENAVEVRKGDTLYSFARRNGVPAAKLAEINGLKAPYDLSGHKTLKLASDQPAVIAVPVMRPDQERQQKQWQFAARKEAEPQAQPVSFPVGRPAPGAPLPRFRPEPGIVQAVAVSDAAEPFKPFAVRPKLSAKKGFIWPVSGEVISSFGPKSGGLYNDGVNIAAPEGSPIHASMDGTVVYVGDDLASYGNLLILRHRNGWLTAYAHTQEILVKKGTKVKRGDVVAKVGRSGNVQTPQVHFGIREGKKPLDPLRKISG